MDRDILQSKLLLQEIGFPPKTCFCNNHSKLWSNVLHIPSLKETIVSNPSQMVAFHNTQDLESIRFLPLDQSVLPIPLQYCKQLKYKLDSDLHTIFSIRINEGFQMTILELPCIRLELLWKPQVRIIYDLKSRKNKKLSVTVGIECGYEFLAEWNWIQNNLHRFHSINVSTSVRRLHLFLSKIVEVDQGATQILGMCGRDKKTVSDVKLNSEEIWNTLANLSSSAWFRWFKTQKIELILTHSGADQTLTEVLEYWSSFANANRTVYVKTIPKFLTYSHVTFQPLCIIQPSVITESMTVLWLNWIGCSPSLRLSILTNLLADIQSVDGISFNNILNQSSFSSLPALIFNPKPIRTMIVNYQRAQPLSQNSNAPTVAHMEAPPDLLSSILYSHRKSWSIQSHQTSSSKRSGSLMTSIMDIISIARKRAGFILINSKIHTFATVLPLVQFTKRSDVINPCSFQYLMYISSNDTLVTEFWMEPQQGFLNLSTAFSSQDNDDQIADFADSKQIFEYLVQSFMQIDRSIITSIRTIDVLSNVSLLQSSSKRGPAQIAKEETESGESTPYSIASILSSPIVVTSYNSFREPTLSDCLTTFGNGSLKTSNEILATMLEDELHSLSDCELDTNSVYWKTVVCKNTGTYCRCFLKTFSSGVILALFPQISGQAPLDASSATVDYIEIEQLNYLYSSEPSSAAPTPSPSASAPMSPSSSPSISRAPSPSLSQPASPGGDGPLQERYKFGVAFYECSLPDIINGFTFRNTIDQLKFAHQREKRRLNSIDVGDGSNALGSSQDRSGYDSDQSDSDLSLSSSYSGPSLSTKQFSSSLRAAYQRSFAKGTFTNIRDKLPVAAADLNSAIDYCREYPFEIDVAQYYRIMAKSLDETQSMKSQMLFEQLIGQYFERIAQSKYFFYSHTSDDIPPDEDQEDSGTDSDWEEGGGDARDSSGSSDGGNTPQTAKRTANSEDQLKQAFSKLQNKTEMGVYPFPFFLRMEFVLGFSISSTNRSKVVSVTSIPDIKYLEKLVASTSSRIKKSTSFGDDYDSSPSSSSSMSPYSSFESSFSDLTFSSEQVSEEPPVNWAEVNFTKTLLRLVCITLKPDQPSESGLIAPMQMIVDQLTASITNLLSTSILCALMNLSPLNEPLMNIVTYNLKRTKKYSYRLNLFCIETETKVFEKYLKQELSRLYFLPLLRISNYFFAIHPTDPSRSSIECRGSVNFTLAEKDHSFTFPYWMVLWVQGSSITFLNFFPGMSREEQARLYSESQNCLKTICNRVNQRILLDALHRSRSCSDLLVPPDESILSSALSETASPSGPKKSTPLFACTRPGELKCPLVHTMNLRLHKRQSAPAVIRALQSSSLNLFYVYNRKNVFVYQEESHDIFYLMLEDFASYSSIINGSSSSSSSSSSSHDGPVSQNPLPSQTTQMQGTNEDQIFCCVYGLNEPGNEIKVRLHELLQNKIDDMAVENLSKLLFRNKKLKLYNYDLELMCYSLSNSPCDSLVSEADAIPTEPVISNEEPALPSSSSASLLSRKPKLFNNDVLDLAVESPFAFKKRVKLPSNIEDMHLFLLILHQNLQKIFFPATFAFKPQPIISGTSSNTSTAVRIDGQSAPSSSSFQTPIESPSVSSSNSPSLMFFQKPSSTDLSSPPVTSSSSHEFVPLDYTYLYSAPAPGVTSASNPHSVPAAPPSMGGTGPSFAQNLGYGLGLLSFLLYKNKTELVRTIQRNGVSRSASSKPTENAQDAFAWDELTTTPSNISNVVNGDTESKNVPEGQDGYYFEIMIWTRVESLAVNLSSIVINSIEQTIFELALEASHLPMLYTGLTDYSKVVPIEKSLRTGIRLETPSVQKINTSFSMPTWEILVLVSEVAQLFRLVCPQSDVNQFCKYRSQSFMVFDAATTYMKTVSGAPKQTQCPEDQQGKNLDYINRKLSLMKPNTKKDYCFSVVQSYPQSPSLISPETAKINDHLFYPLNRKDPRSLARNLCCIAVIRHEKLSLWCYNWNESLVDRFNTELNRLLQYVSLRNKLLNNFMYQKMGVFFQHSDQIVPDAVVQQHSRQMSSFTQRLIRNNNNTSSSSSSSSSSTPSPSKRQPLRIKDFSNVELLMVNRFPQRHPSLVSSNTMTSSSSSFSVSSSTLSTNVGLLSPSKASNRTGKTPIAEQIAKSAVQKPHPVTDDGSDAEQKQTARLVLTGITNGPFYTRTFERDDPLTAFAPAWNSILKKQSTSQALQKRRSMLDDPLLLHGRQMISTVRTVAGANQLRDSINQILACLLERSPISNDQIKLLLRQCRFVHACRVPFPLDYLAGCGLSFESSSGAEGLSESPVDFGTGYVSSPGTNFSPVSTSTPTSSDSSPKVPKTTTPSASPHVQVKNDRASRVRIAALISQFVNQFSAHLQKLQLSKVSLLDERRNLHQSLVHENPSESPSSSRSSDSSDVVVDPDSLTFDSKKVFYYYRQSSFGSVLIQLSFHDELICTNVFSVVLDPKIKPTPQASQMLLQLTEQLHTNSFVYDFCLYRIRMLVSGVTSDSDVQDRATIQEETERRKKQSDGVLFGISREREAQVIRLFDFLDASYERPPSFSISQAFQWYVDKPVSILNLHHASELVYQFLCTNSSHYGFQRTTQMLILLPSFTRQTLEKTINEIHCSSASNLGASLPSAARDLLSHIAFSLREWTHDDDFEYICLCFFDAVPLPPTSSNADQQPAPMVPQYSASHTNANLNLMSTSMLSPPSAVALLMSLSSPPSTSPSPMHSPTNVRSKTDLTTNLSDSVMRLKVRLVKVHKKRMTKKDSSDISVRQLNRPMSVSLSVSTPSFDRHPYQSPSSSGSTRLSGSQSSFSNDFDHSPRRNVLSDACGHFFDRLNRLPRSAGRIFSHTNRHIHSENKRDEADASFSEMVEMCTVGDQAVILAVNETLSQVISKAVDDLRSIKRWKKLVGSQSVQNDWVPIIRDVISCFSCKPIEAVDPMLSAIRDIDFPAIALFDILLTIYGSFGRYCYDGSTHHLLLFNVNAPYNLFLYVTVKSAPVATSTFSQNFLATPLASSERMSVVSCRKRPLNLAQEDDCDRFEAAQISEFMRHLTFVLWNTMNQW